MISDPRPQPPWDFFHDASIASLQSFELSRLNNAANLRRQIAALLDQWVNDNSQALLARWVREQRALPQAACGRAEIDASPRQSVLPLDSPATPALLSPDASAARALPLDASAAATLLPRRAERPSREAARTPKLARSRHHR